jgi:hypothetical protein
MVASLVATFGKFGNTTYRAVRHRQSVTGHSALAVRSSSTVDDRLNLRGWAVGTLHRWLCSGTGQWIGVCTIVIGRGDGSTYRAVDQRMPAQALRRRTT